MSSELIDRATSDTDTIDRTKSKLSEDRSAVMDVTESTCVPAESNESKSRSNDGESKDSADTSEDRALNNILADNNPESEGVMNGTDIEETGSIEKPAGSNLSTADEVTLAASANCPVNNLEKLNETHKEEVPKKREDSSSDQNAASPTSTEQCNSIALPPPASAASADPISPSENTSSSNNDTCSSVAAMETDNVEGAMATCSSASSPSSDKAPIQSVYHVKWIKFKGNTVAIITQNENGPCPLLAIMNVLLLKEKIKLPGMIEMVTSGQLMEYLGDCIFENAPKDITEDAQLNYEQNMHDAMAVFHKLQTGLDVNVKFTGVNDFEYTSECIVFDLLNIPLYHGWLTDPESPEVVAAIGSCSYNQLVEKIISQKNSKKEELMTEALICEEFLERTAAQLTYHGLSELVTSVKEDEMCVFFRNNHFSTLYKYKNELFLLVTDQGFLTESNVVWETLCNVEGDGHFVDADFRTYRKPEPSTVPIVAPPVPVGSDQQIDQDYLVALSLQQEAPPADMAMSWPTSGQPAPHLSDHELAIQLQEEENRRAAAAAAPAAQHQRQPAHRTQSAPVGGATSQKKKDKDCIIL